jgi:hypothetical protein
VYEVINYFRTMIRDIDSSLVDEWEALHADPDDEFVDVTSRKKPDAPPPPADWRAIEPAPVGPPFAPVFTQHFAFHNTGAPALVGPAAIEVTVLRRGRNLSNLDARMMQSGEVVARASAVFSEARAAHLDALGDSRGQWQGRHREPPRRTVDVPCLRGPPATTARRGADVRSAASCDRIA